MAGKMYATHDGTWEDLLAIIKTAQDWNVDEIVLVGTENMEKHVEGLRLHWEKYMIPIRLVGPITGGMIDEPVTFAARNFDIPPRNLKKTGTVVLNSGSGVPQAVTRATL